MDRIVDHILAFEGDGKIKDFTGNFSEYREKKSQEQSKKSQVEEAEPPSQIVSNEIKQYQTKNKLTFKEQRELETIEKEMPELEEKRAKILEFLNNETDYEKISVLSKDLESISEKLEEMEMRWLELQIE